MNKERLTRLLAEPAQVAAEDLAGLRDLVQRHPWFSGAQVLLAKGEHATGDVLGTEHLRDAAAHVPSREVLYHAAKAEIVAASAPMHVVRDEEPEIAVSTPVAVEQPTVAPPAPIDELTEPLEEPAQPEVIPVVEEAPPPSDEEMAARILEQQMLEAAISTGYSLEAMVMQDTPAPTAAPTVQQQPVAPPMRPMVLAARVPGARMSFGAWLDTDIQAVPKPVAPAKPSAPPVTEKAETPVAPDHAEGSAPSATRSAIDRFLAKTPIEPPKKAAFFSPQEAGRRSLRDHADMVSETLARIYEQQGNYAKAEEAYRKLALKVPEKAAYFAALSQAAAEKQKKEG
ncbi:MAG: hypothetical protein IPJ76_11990 [Flavobacteriales bacterium]|nr:MAG: hypothetical protein IPJ76_11990 [Flavobacteriales bacterium]